MVTTRPADAPASVEWIPWSDLHTELDETWSPDAPHVSIFGQTRSGKSHLIRHGLMKLCAYDRVLVIDNKGGDPTWAGFGKRVGKLPRFMVGDHRKPGAFHYRLIVPDTREDGRRIVHEALARVYREGHWVVVLDETRAIADPADPGLGMKPWLERMWLRGASKGIVVVAGTQAPRWVPGSMYDQAGHAFLGRIRDSEAQKRLREIGGFDRRLDAVVAGLQRRDWMYVGEAGDRIVLTRVE